MLQIIILGKLDYSLYGQRNKNHLYMEQKYTPLYEKDIKQNQNKPIETTVWLGELDLYFSEKW